MLDGMFVRGIVVGASRLFRDRDGWVVRLLLLAVLGAAPTGIAADRTDAFLLAGAATNRVVEAGDHPNVLFIIVDDLNVALGTYSGSTPHPHYQTADTPHIDRLAASGVRFDRAYVQYPLCNPSRISMLSGLRPRTTGIYDGGTPPRSVIGTALRLLPEHFRDQGYFTARVGKVGHNRFEHAISWDVSHFALSREPALRFHLPGFLPGVDRATVRDNTWTADSARGMSREAVMAAVGRPLGLPLSWRATDESPRMTPDGTTATRVIQLMAEHRDQPFFIAAGFHKPHQPWVGPVEFFDRHPTASIELPATPVDDADDIPAPALSLAPDDAAHSDDQLRQAIAAYHAMVSMTDSYVGELLDALDLLELERSTIVVFTSDHGFQLGEHGGAWRKRLQFEESTRVPLIVRVPGLGETGSASSGLIELVDLYPTLIDLAGIAVPAHALEGDSFAPLLRSPDQAWKSAAFSESVSGAFHGRTIRDWRYRYTEWTAPNRPVLRELYDLERDPFEHTNLAAGDDHDRLIDTLSARLAAGWMAARPGASG